MNSSYMSTDILEATTKLMRNPIRNPIRIKVYGGDRALECIRQFYISVEKEESKVDILVGLFENINFTPAVTIFCNTRRDVDLVTEKLRESIRTVSAIHSKIEQAQHETISTDFCSASSRVLVTTDLPTLGFDIRKVSLVINYELPTNPENYIRRVRSVGRAVHGGRKGVVINLITDVDAPLLREIERFYYTRINEMPGDVASKLRITAMAMLYLISNEDQQRSFLN